MENQGRVEPTQSSPPTRRRRPFKPSPRCRGSRQSARRTCSAVSSVLPAEVTTRKRSGSRRTSSKDSPPAPVRRTGAPRRRGDRRRFDDDGLGIAPVAGDFGRDIEHQGSVRPPAAGRQTIHFVEDRELHAPAKALVGVGRIGKAITQYMAAGGERRIHHFHQMLSTAGKDQQRFHGTVESAPSGIEKDLSDGLAQSRPTRLVGDEMVYPARSSRWRATQRRCVDLPLPSRPSKVMKWGAMTRARY